MSDYLIASIIGTFCAEIITLPICTIKTNYQNNQDIKINDTIKMIYKNNGYRGFLQACTPAITSQIISTSSKFTFYEIIKKHRKTEEKDLLNNMINGMAGGIVGSIFSHPFDVWKNHLQRSEKFNFLSDYKKYYQGYHTSIYKNIVLYSSLFPIYDYYKNKFSSIYLSSILTSLTVSTIIQPFDYYKTIKLANTKINNYNIKLFYRGYSLMLFRSIPHFLITMAITEKIKNL